jgi:hypothetical protein
MIFRKNAFSQSKFQPALAASRESKNIFLMLVKCSPIQELSTGKVEKCGYGSRLGATARRAMCEIASFDT